MKKTLKIVQALLLLAVLTACSSGPSSSDLETQLKPVLVKPVWDVVSIRKLEGKTDKSAGIPVHMAKVEYMIKFKKGIQDMKDEYEKDRVVEEKKLDNKYKKSRNSLNTDNFIDAASSHLSSVMAFRERGARIGELEREYGNFKAGDTKTLTKRCDFEKTDKGWTLIEFTL